MAGQTIFLFGKGNSSTARHALSDSRLHSNTRVCFGFRALWRRGDARRRPSAPRGRNWRHSHECRYTLKFCWLWIVYKQLKDSRIGSLCSDYNGCGLGELSNVRGAPAEGLKQARNRPKLFAENRR